MAAMAVIIGIIIAAVDNGGSVTAADSSISFTSDDRTDQPPSVPFSRVPATSASSVSSLSLAGIA